MIPKLQRILLAIAAALIAVDLAWGFAGGFQVDVLAYGKVALLSAALVGAGIFYQVRRAEPRIAAMLLGASFLCAFSAAASLLNYFLLTFHGPRIDGALAAADLALGFDWAAVMTAVADYPLSNTVLFFVYNIVLPEIALMTVLLGWRGNAEKTYRFCIAVAVSALLCMAVWSAFPSFGAFSIHPQQPAFAGMTLALDSSYAAELVRLLEHGPGLISPRDTQGLIGFPSYHAVLALLVVWYARAVPRLFWPLAAVNALVLVATPIQGGHHLVDVLAAFPVTALALWLAGDLAIISRKPSGMVNRLRKFTIGPVPQGLFRIAPAQSHDDAPPAIKSKLSGFS
ncbi:MAG: phosphatase PAP2 family protein [Pseudomonadota bacterium]